MISKYKHKDNDKDKEIINEDCLILLNKDNQIYVPHCETATEA